MQSSSASPAPVKPAPLLSLAIARQARASAELTRKIGRGCHTALPSVAPGAILCLENADGAGPADSGSLYLAGAFGEIEISGGVRFLRALTGLDLGAAEVAGTGPSHAWLRSVLCGRMAATPFGALDAISVQPLHAPQQGERVWTRMTLRTGSHAIVSYAAGSAEQWLRVLASGAWTADAMPGERNAGFPLSLPALLARHRLPASVLGTLRPGDVILPASTRFNCAGEGVLACGGLTLRVRFLAPCSLTILALENNMLTNEWQDEAAAAGLTQDRENEYEERGHEERGDGQPGAASGAPDALAEPASQDDDGISGPVFDSLPVALDFELGRATLTLGALRRLAAGTTLLLDGGGPAAVAIVSGGRRIGLGEAVDVDGQLGIRIVEWDAA